MSTYREDMNTRARKIAVEILREQQAVAEKPEPPLVPELDVSFETYESLRREEKERMLSAEFLETQSRRNTLAVVLGLLKAYEAGGVYGPSLYLGETLSPNEKSAGHTISCMFYCAMAKVMSEQEELKAKYPRPEIVFGDTELTFESWVRQRTHKHVSAQRLIEDQNLMRECRREVLQLANEKLETLIAEIESGTSLDRV